MAERKREKAEPVNPSSRVLEELAEKNTYIKDVQDNKIIYKTEFYLTMYQLMEKKGLTAVQAYEKLGFPVDKLGENRANACGKRAREMAADGSFADPAKYDGSIPRERLGDLTPEEEAAYYKARTAYLEALIDLEKKLQLRYPGKNISLKRG